MPLQTVMGFRASKSTVMATRKVNVFILASRNTGFHGSTTNAIIGTLFTVYTFDAKLLVSCEKIVEGSNNAKLRVSFFRPFYGNYWVLVGESKCAFGWVLARDNTLDAAALNSILDRAAAQGYDRSAFKTSL